MKTEEMRKKLKEEFEELTKDIEPYIEKDPTIIKLDGLQERITLINEVEKYKILFWVSFAFNLIYVILIFSKIFKF